MAEVLVATTTGKDAVLKEAVVEGFRSSFYGELLLAEDPDYGDVRALWNGMIGRKPALIARCTGAADVMTAVRFAREHDLEVSVRGGGHSVAGHSLTDGGMMIDLAPMTGVRVDPLTHTATAQGGCLWKHVDREAQAFGMAFTGGIVTHTGVAGLTLGGGLGHLMRKFGLTIDSLRSCDVVTADGEFMVANEERNAELFWALRGGGGNFGIVTSFEFDLHPLGPTVLAGMLAYPMDEAPEVLRFFRDFVADAPDEVGIMGNLRLAPAMPVIPQELHGKPIVALIICYAGPVDAGKQVLRPLLEFKEAAVNAVAPKPYLAHQAMFDAALPHGRHYYWKSWKLPPLTDELIKVIVEQAEKITSPFSTVPIFTQGGAVSRVPDDSTAYAGRHAAHDINIVAAWEPDDPEPERHISWVRDFWEALTPYSQGVYVNFLADEPQSAVEAAYGSKKYPRLVALKNKYDPTNFFCLNQNIKPTG